MNPTKFDATQFEIDRALAGLGLSPNKIQQQPIDEDTPTKLPTPSEVFEETGAGLRESALTIANAMMNASNPNVQLKAAELALRVHGIFKDIESKGGKIPEINININSVFNEDGQSKTLVQVFMPTT